MIKLNCPVCGYAMDQEPANYHVCPSCGTEFGLHDQNATYEELRTAWMKTGPKWWSVSDPEPPNWDPLTQMENAIQVRQAKLPGRVVFVEVPTGADPSAGLNGPSRPASNVLPAKEELPTVAKNIDRVANLQFSR